MSQSIDSLAGLMIKWRDDPELFVRQVLGGEPFPWQCEALASYAANSRLAIKSGKGVGKSALLAWILLHFLCTRHEAKIACTATTAPQLYDVLWAEVRKWRDSIPEEYEGLFRIEMTAERVYLDGMQQLNFAVAKTARREQPEALQGIHAKNTLFLIDEASGVPDEIFAVAEGAMSTEGAKVVMTGNATRTDGYFFDAFHGDYRRWVRMTVSGADSPAVSEDYLEYMKLKWGEDSNEYRVGVLGEFPLSGNDDRVMSLGLVQGGIGRTVSVGEATPVVWGVDVARMGSDRTAVAKRHGHRLLEKVVSWSGKDLVWSKNKIMEMWAATSDALRPIEICIDEIGTGAGLLEMLGLAGLPVRGVNVAKVSTRPDKYYRLRDELWFRGREWFEAGGSIPDDKDLVAELVSVGYEFRANGARAIVDKKAGGVSPDLADAFLLSLSGYNARQGRDVVYDNSKWGAVADCSANYVGVGHGTMPRWDTAQEWY